ncbi:MAG: hypothetical protein ABI539_07155 [Acidobacteriota bacterium]
MSDRFAAMRVLAVSIALDEVGKNVREDIAGNRGTHIDKYLKRANSPLDAGHNWCGMFVNWVFMEAASRLGQIFPIPPGTMWSGPKLKRWAETNWESMVWEFPLLAGDIYVMNKGHIGMVRAPTHEGSDLMFTIDGNQSTFTAGGISLVQRTRSFSDMDTLIRIV